MAEICAITGHNKATAAAILQHYLGRHPEIADNAIAKLVSWHAGASS